MQVWLDSSRVVGTKVEARALGQTYISTYIARLMCLEARFTFMIVPLLDSEGH